MTALPVARSRWRGRDPGDHGLLSAISPSPRRGFTLLELLIVIGVLGVLGSLITARVGAARAKTYRATLQSDLRNYAVAQESHLERVGTYAASPAALTGFALSEHAAVDSASGSVLGWYLRLTRAGGDSLVCAMSRTTGRSSDLRPDCSSAGVYALPSTLEGNLVLNGLGDLGNATNFPGTTFDGAARVPGAYGSFRTTSYTSVVAGSFPWDSTAAYELSTHMKYAGPRPVWYAGFSASDAGGGTISSEHYQRYPGSVVTTLAAPLAPGDLTVALASSAGWYNGTTGAGRTLAIGGYVTADGRNWGSEYTRRILYHAGTGAWDPGAINTATHVITLRAPFPASLANPVNGGVWPVGTVVWNGYGSGTYHYCLNVGSAVAASDWRVYTGTIAAGYNRSGTYAVCRVPPGTTRLQPLFLHDWSNLGSTIWISRVVIREK